MVIQRRLEFGEQGFAETGITDHNERLELVAEAAKMFFLMFTEVHGREV